MFGYSLVSPGPRVRKWDENSVLNLLNSMYLWRVALMKVLPQNNELIPGLEYMSFF